MWQRNFWSRAKPFCDTNVSKTNKFLLTTCIFGMIIDIVNIVKVCKKFCVDWMQTICEIISLSWDTFKIYAKTAEQQTKAISCCCLQKPQWWLKDLVMISRGSIIWLWNKIAVMAMEVIKIIMAKKMQVCTNIKSMYFVFFL